jgi:hypothetical protein
MTYLIEAKGLRKQYDDFTAVDGATFNINAGEVVGFLCEECKNLIQLVSRQPIRPKPSEAVTKCQID